LARNSNWILAYLTRDALKLYIFKALKLQNRQIMYTPWPAKYSYLFWLTNQSISKKRQLTQKQMLLLWASKSVRRCGSHKLAQKLWCKAQNISVVYFSIFNSLLSVNFLFLSLFARAVWIFTNKIMPNSIRTRQLEFSPKFYKHVKE